MKIKLSPLDLNDGLALIAGILLTLAFAPFSAYILAPLSAAALMWTWSKSSQRRAFYRGWLFGLGLFGSGVYWVYISIHNFGNASAFLAIIITCVFVAFLALFPALSGLLLARYFKLNDENKFLLAFPVIMVFFEWIRSQILTGFPWLLVGTSQVNSPLKGFGPIIGVYGLSLLVYYSGGLLVNILNNIKIKNNRRILGYSGLLLGIWLTGGLLNFISWTHPKGSPVQVSLVQGNISQDVHWDPDHTLSTLETYRNLTLNHLTSKIIVWPENAIPLPLGLAVEFIDNMEEDANKTEATIITGIPIQHPQKKDFYFNGIITFGHDTGYYLKRRLVPFGEYTPLPNVFSSVMDTFKIPMSSMIGAEEPAKPLIVHGLKIAAFVCYEIAFPELVAYNNDNIDVLLTVSNDAWFGESIALAQHLQMGQMRALELGRPLLFVSNTGITAFVSPKGVIVKTAPPFQPYVLTSNIQAMEGQTPWQKSGMDGVFLIMVIALYKAITRQRHKLRAS